jgi:hypothetical protein
MPTPETYLVYAEHAYAVHAHVMHAHVIHAYIMHTCAVHCWSCIRINVNMPAVA